MHKALIIFYSIWILSANSLFSQEEDLLSMLGDDEPTQEYVAASFKTNR
ncbi:MAG: hypothetical protein HKN16_12325, partial [Saprospiraceae bacterium]|nr:hypothetical protein [Saprospiraceae bacterium]